MKIQDTKQMDQKILQLSAERDLNARVTAGVVNAINEFPVVPSDVGIFKKIASDMYDNLKEGGYHWLTMEQAEVATLVEMIMANSQAPIFQSEEEEDVILAEISKVAKVFHQETFAENPYLKNIHFNGEISGEFELITNYYDPYEIFVYDVPKTFDDHFFSVPRIGCFDEKFEFPCITEGNYTWMSVTPNEIFTMQKLIDAASGNVLTLGCGMGYYAYMVSLKEDVESVTIIEKEKSVIDMFKKYILPQFENKEKIHIIQAEAFSFMENLEDGIYDYCFSDILADIGDFVSYMDLKKICKKFEKMQMSYWIEEAIVENMLSSIHLEVMQSYYEAKNMELPPFNELPAYFYKQLGYVRELLKNESVKTPEGIHFYMNAKNIISML